MIKNTYDCLKLIADNNVCSEHGKPLTVAHHATEDCFVLRCGEGEYPDAVRRIPTAAEVEKTRVKEPQELTPPEARRLRSGNKPSTAAMTIDDFAGVPKTDLGSGAALTVPMLQAMVAYANRYGLDPYRGHVVIMYGKPYIGLDGYLFYAHKLGRPYSMDTKPMTTDELAACQLKTGDHGWMSKIKMLDTDETCVGVGVVTREEMDKKSPRDAEKLACPVVAAHPWQLAQKRAEWQALRRAFPIGESAPGEDNA